VFSAAAHWVCEFRELQSTELQEGKFRPSGVASAAMVANDQAAQVMVYVRVNFLTEHERGKERVLCE
jgi:hypothetical protein